MWASRSHQPNGNRKIATNAINIRASLLQNMPQIQIMFEPIWFIRKHRGVVKASLNVNSNHASIIKNVVYAYGSLGSIQYGLQNIFSILWAVLFIYGPGDNDPSEPVWVVNQMLTRKMS